MSELSVRAAKRTFFERWFKDPLIGLTTLVLWGIFRVLPLDAASAVGSFIGRFLALVAVRKNKVALYNLQKCFPEKTDKERKQIIKGMWQNLARVAAEMPHYKKMNDRIRIEGLEYVDAVKSKNIGGFFMSGHLGNWELFMRVVMSLGMPVHLVYRSANNPWIERFVFQKRRTKGTQLIPKGTTGARMMIDVLRKKEYVGMLCDQKLREGIDVPFFGSMAKTAPAIATLALKYGTPIVPARLIRSKGAHYVCTFFPALELPNTGDREKDTYLLMLKINQILEDWIRETPEQWLWIHHRWDKSEYPR